MGSHPLIGDAERLTVVVVDADEIFSHALRSGLEHEGYEVSIFQAGATALKALTTARHDYVVLVDWRLPDMYGVDFLQSVRALEGLKAVVCLSSRADIIYEELALQEGAADFIEKSRGLGVLLRRLQLIVGDTRAAGVSEEASAEPEELRVGALVVDPQACRAYWDGRRVDLTIGEFRVVQVLAENAGKDVPHRTIYDVIHGPDVVAGHGDHGFRSNVRTLIRRIRKKFSALDPEFDQIESYAGFGYRWALDPPPDA